MKISSLTKNAIATGIKYMIISAVISFFIPVFIGKPSLNNFFGSVCIGSSCCLSIYLLSLALASRQIRWPNLFLELTVTTFLYVIDLAFFTFIFLYIFDMFNLKSNSGGSILIFLNNSIFIMSITAGCIITLFFIFINNISTMLGQGVLGKILTGKYHHPKEEERIFMFLDISSSTAIAERIGHMRFLSLLDDFFCDITEAAFHTHAEIYKYVGDEVILVWKMKEGIKDANCLNVFFKMKEKIEKEGNKYMRKYGLVPVFKAGLHGGMAVAGEMGLIKREIAYIGDVVNTAARIEGMCNSCGETFLVSGDIFEKIQIPVSIRSKDLGRVRLRGKEQEITLFALCR